MEVSETSPLVPKTKIKTKRLTSDLSVIFAIICMVDVFGVFPVVALPKAIIDCGFYGILVVIVVVSTQMYTAILLGKCWLIAQEIDPSIHRKNRYPYSALAEITYGTHLANVVSFLLDLTIFGGGIPNLIVASQNLHLVGLRISDNTFDFSFCYWIIIIGIILCPFLWLGSPKDMKLLCSISVAMVIMVFLLITGCLIFSDQEVIADTNTFNDRPLWELIFAAYGIISFQYDIHPTILTIQVDMKNKSKLPIAVMGAFACSLGMFAIVTIIAALKFGNEGKPSILETLSSSLPLYFAAVFVALQLCLSSAVSNSALYQHMEDCMSISRNFNHRRCVLRTMLTLLAILIAQSVPRFDLVMSLIGGTLTGPIVFILPPLIYLRMMSIRKKHVEELVLGSFKNLVYGLESPDYTIRDPSPEFHSNNNLETCICILIIILTTVCTIVSTYVNIKSAITFANFSQPCILNVSNALLNY